MNVPHLSFSPLSALRRGVHELGTSLQGLARNCSCLPWTVDILSLAIHFVLAPTLRGVQGMITAKPVCGRRSQEHLVRASGG